MVLQTHNVAHTYPGQNSLSFPDIALKKGETALLLGSSGKGKTTLLHLLAGLLPLQKGAVHIAQTNLSSLSPRALDRFRGRHIGLIFQQSYFLPYLTIAENLQLAQKISGTTPHITIADALAELSAKQLLPKKPAQCSTGEQQRASIARALLGKPTLLLADEPTSALDDANAKAVAQMLQKAAQEHQAALLIVTHDMRLSNYFSKHFTL